MGFLDAFYDLLDQKPASTWEDKGSYLRNPATGETRPKPVAGGTPSALHAGRAGLPPVPSAEQLERNLPRWRQEARELRVFEERRGNEPGAAEAFRRDLLSRHPTPSPHIEDRRDHIRLDPEWGNRSAPPARREVGDPRPWGRANSYPPGFEGKSYDETPPDVAAAMKADSAFRDAQAWREEDDGKRTQPGDAPFSEEEWRSLREYGYESTRSPLLLRKRHPNGTVTYVHASEVRDDPKWPWGAFGMNAPRGDADEERDPFWREGRRDW